jgi:ankyrin repeat protein
LAPLSLTQHLLEHRAEVNAIDDEGCTPAHKAASLGHADVLALLIRHGAALDVRDGAGMLPLHAAALRGFIDCVKCLLRCAARWRGCA